jgi:hypothetical protein
MQNNPQHQLQLSNDENHRAALLHLATAVIHSMDEINLDNSLSASFYIDKKGIFSTDYEGVYSKISFKCKYINTFSSIIKAFYKKDLSGMQERCKEYLSLLSHLDTENEGFNNAVTSLKLGIEQSQK